MTEKSTEEYLIDIFKLKEVPQDKEWRGLLENAEVKTYKKNEAILKQHLRFTDVLFVAEGILASEFTMKDKTVIGRFFTPGNLCTNFDSLLNQTVSQYQVVSMTSCRVITISAAQFMEYYYNGSNVGKVLRKIVLEIITEDIWMTNIKLMYQKPEMIAFMQQHYPEVVRDVPYKYVALFLGITPEAYSRILKKGHSRILPKS
ncbi:Crp/Fnr family transcriptional regulator [Elizabethkingia miricola]|uniref:Crp/Fnr family transcriptional regulator n=1 Tax=Elizabethkingia miricola TaxID=172045 RepID=UPI001375E616|nr:cyclic nucleotide-binding domain-containing protein [Elizabethkingia miricola]NHQ67604.1 Crp/Fnr family transcriptional regulator [Elizabethkingia miricola]NHQ71096.1 Crp/Fnr family transcriptional regulator [Elizabethkingia miricola]NHQ78548.1 Crp/Fnr family transcriptional regulator [Elizabethkingia miricola]UIO96037.1 cyclic nucleotide-binding domain-containing protein [Elizabethkingia miricola]WER12822.1 cyclic nucleotide-binding domain-containing protein [Elizabethkingia miricola]